jgi:Spy/CpxP family protein refolding chaperone
MRTLSRALLLVAVTALVVGQSAAQDGEKKGKGKGGFGGRGGAVGLVQNESVQKELKLTEEQVTKSKKAAEDILAKFKDDFAKLKDATPEERAAVSTKVSAEAYKVLGDILNTDQVKRLKQIDLQVRGLNNPEAQETLKLTAEQKEKVKKLGDEAGEKMREIFKDAQGNFEQAREKMTSLRKETQEKQAGVLTDDQKKQWQDMTGEPFQIQFAPRRRAST